MIIRTKIVATVGPACATAEVLTEMVEAGVDVFRINFSHGSPAQRGEALANIRRIEEQLGTSLAVMADLCGPKIRVGEIAGGSCLLGAGSRVTVCRETVVGNPEMISTTLAELVDHVEPGQSVGLDEGRIRLRIEKVRPGESFDCEVTTGGVLASGKGVQLPETELALAALTEKDRADVEWIRQRDFDFVALSFVQRAEDIVELRELLDDAIRIVAKIEKPQALARIEEILDVSDAIMVARGDLGAEMSLPQVPIAQKRLVRLARETGTPCIVATQMLETMTHSAQPTRAEAADIANAVLDGTDAVMLSGETAVGDYPVQAVAMMNDIAAAAEEHEAEHPAPVRVEYAPARTPAALAAAAREVIEREDIAAAAVFTATGTTANVLAKQRLAVPILAMSPSQRVVRQMSLLYGVRSVVEPAPEHTREVLALAAKHLAGMKLVAPGEKILVLSGRPIGVSGATNTLVVHTVGA